LEKNWLHAGFAKANDEKLVFITRSNIAENPHPCGTISNNVRVILSLATHRQPNERHHK